MKPAMYARHWNAALLPVGPVIQPTKGPYSGFNQINGQHPFKFAVPNGYIDYEARILRGSKVVYFNFALAKEMGLIEKNHPLEMDAALEKILVETFALRIINEYDQLTGLKVSSRDLKPNRYMATRYLQLQHDNKAGVTSGDGRSIWNGQFVNPISQKVWDISSCGTGVTRLSPGFVATGKPVKTGDKTVSYGSGLADIDEGLTAAILSESFHERGILTERTLVILETPEGRGINVRSAPNLLRPSHLFLHLKQNNHATLKAALDFYIARQIQNKAWESVPRESDKYEYVLKHLAQKYARFAARLEDEYIFCWLDWDGDNVLMEAGIIDYGSIRQFGLYHHQYRYDDVDRFSTNLKEQKRKARNLVQTFIQLIDFVRTGTKKDWSAYGSHDLIEYFEKTYRESRRELVLKRIGLNIKQRSTRPNPTEVALLRDLKFFEECDWNRGQKETPDGINKPAIFCIRSLLRELPRRLMTERRELTSNEILSLMQTENLSKKEFSKAVYHRKALKLQRSYLQLLRLKSKESLHRTLLETAMRASANNPVHYVTGDGIIYVVDELLKKRSRLNRKNFTKLVDAFTAWQKGVPYKSSLGKTGKAIFLQLNKIVQETKHSI